MSTATVRSRAYRSDEKYARSIRSSAGIAVFVAEQSDHEHWVRPQFAAAIGLGTRRPDLVVRFGYGAQMPRSLRSSVDAVIVA